MYCRETRSDDRNTASLAFITYLIRPFACTRIAHSLLSSICTNNAAHPRHSHTSHSTRTSSKTHARNLWISDSHTEPTMAHFVAMKNSKTPALYSEKQMLPANAKHDASLLCTVGCIEASSARCSEGSRKQRNVCGISV